MLLPRADVPKKTGSNSSWQSNSIRGAVLLRELVSIDLRRLTRRLFFCLLAYTRAMAGFALSNGSRSHRTRRDCVPHNFATAHFGVRQPCGRFSQQLAQFQIRQDSTTPIHSEEVSMTNAYSSAGDARRCQLPFSDGRCCRMWPSPLIPSSAPSLPGKNSFSPNPNAWAPKFPPPSTAISSPPPTSTTSSANFSPPSPRTAYLLAKPSQFPVPLLSRIWIRLRDPFLRSSIPTLPKKNDRCSGWDEPTIQY